MPPPSGVKQFPDLSNKLAAPKKGSLFERQKQEAEAKRLREEAETAAVFDEFVKSFSNEDASTEPSVSRESSGSRPGGGRHFHPSSKKSGPGSLGPAPQIGTKRHFNGSAHMQRNARGVLSSDSMPFRATDSEIEQAASRAAERAIAKPTVQMSSLPPGTSPAVIRSLLPEELVVDDVATLRSTGNADDRRTDSAIVTFAKDTPASAIDTAVSGLQNRYLERGYRLSLSRHLSSATISAARSTGTSSSSATLPFGAVTTQPRSSSSLRNAPPPSYHDSRFAPPHSYSATGRSGTHVPVRAPRSLSQVRLINKTVEEVLVHGPDFEALLMSRPAVQREERWSFLWNARSEAGIWYRWRLWDVVSGTQARTDDGTSAETKARQIFDGSTPWVEYLGDRLAYEFVTGLEEVRQSKSYKYSDEFESGDESEAPKRSQAYGNRNPAGPDLSNLSMDDDSKPRYLNPTQRARLIHMLARLPTTSAKLRRGDVARVTGFAIAHAGASAEEIADLLVGNTVRPFSVTEQIRHARMDEDGSAIAQTVEVDEDRDRDLETTSQAILVGLHVLSDVLSASSTSGIRHSWKYRTLIFSNLSSFCVFSRLGKIERAISKNVGRIRAEKWRRSILQGVVVLWETWGLLTGDDMMSLVQEYEAGTKEPKQDVDQDVTASDALEDEKKESRWRAVDAQAADSATLQPREPDTSRLDGHDLPMPNSDHHDDYDDDDSDGEDIDGIPMESDSDSDAEEKSQPSVGSNDGRHAASNHNAPKPVDTAAEATGGGSKIIRPKQRPRAVDMLSSSDEDTANGPGKKSHA